MLLVVLGFKKIGFLFMLGGHNPQACSLFCAKLLASLVGKVLVFVVFTARTITKVCSMHHLRATKLHRKFGIQCFESA
ncbi:hypothetical protein EJ73_01872 [Hoylesella shahii DSM 15611 = JCM 12083]|uniref:Uncharacterized protein n=1 Tax=Hoylesella shahii DSM 15611 = JCM 12083 TaxID=1122991 RepID=A0A318HX23_9BACT|nr:hypothetical protein EJ73_01872 [Hoylesella shahii DSM 15611 = JCM 12083]